MKENQIQMMAVCGLDCGACKIRLAPFQPNYMFASIQTSRGCPMDCEFCSVTAFNGRRYRRRPVEEVIQKMSKGKAYLAYLPFPTELCVLCASRTKKGLEPACVQHCMAPCMKYGRIEELAKEMGEKPRMVLWSPR